MTWVTNVTRGAAGLTMAALLLAPAGFAKNKKSNNQEPVAWGMQSGNSGCVIFRESEEMTSQMAPGGGGYTTQTSRVLEVVDGIHATLPHKKYNETQADLTALQDLSMQNHLKYVKIPKKFTPEQLEKAKTLCGVQ